MITLLDLAIVGAVAGAAGLAARAIILAVRHPLHFEETRNADLSSELLKEPSAWKFARVLIGAPAILLIIIVSRESRTSRETTRIQAAARQEVEAAYEAAAQAGPAPSDTVETRPEFGYVYLGQCDKGWLPNTRRFGGLKNCHESIPPAGILIYSWKGDVIRNSLPATVNGQRKLGKEIDRVSYGRPLLLVEVVPSSVFPSGPQYYWGRVKLPDKDQKQ